MLIGSNQVHPAGPSPECAPPAVIAAPSATVGVTRRMSVAICEGLEATGRSLGYTAPAAIGLRRWIGQLCIQYRLCIWNGASPSCIGITTWTGTATVCVCQEDVDVRIKERTVEVHLKAEQIDKHVRSHHKGGGSDMDDHLPESHPEARQLNTRQECLSAAEPAAEELIHIPLTDTVHPVRFDRSLLSIQQLGSQHGTERLEAARKCALVDGANRYYNAAPDLKNLLDRQADSQQQIPPIQHDNDRSQNCYENF